MDWVDWYIRILRTAWQHRMDGKFGPQRFQRTSGQHRAAGISWKCRTAWSARSTGVHWVHRPTGFYRRHWIYWRHWSAWIYRLVLHVIPTIIPTVISTTFLNCDQKLYWCPSLLQILSVFFLCHCVQPYKVVYGMLVKHCIGDNGCK